MKRKPQSVFVAVFFALLLTQCPNVLAFPFSVSNNLITFQQEKLSIAKGISIKRDIGAGEVHSFRLALVTNQYLLVTVKQIRIDIVATLFAPDGEKLLESDNFRGLGEAERLSFVTKVSGD